MRLLALSAAGLVAILALSVAAYGRGGPSEVVATCSATDRKFIRDASLNMVAVGSSGRDFLAGSARAKDVIADAERAARIVAAGKPSDPSLERTRPLLAAMFASYGRAIEARARKRDAGPHMYRAYGLANFAHDVLAKAEPQLRQAGCDVSALL